MRIIVKVENAAVIARLKAKVDVAASGKWRAEAARGLADAGRQTRTQVQRAVHQQMATRAYRDVTANTRGVLQPGRLLYEIFSVKGGMRIEAYKGLKAGSGDPGVAGQVRSGVWNAPRTFERSFATNGGYFALLPGSPGTPASTIVGGKGVGATRIIGGKRAPLMLWTWGAKPGQPRDAAGRFAPSGKTYGPIRRLFGPALRDELVKDQSLATFHRVAPVMLQRHVTKRVAKLVLG